MPTSGGQEKGAEPRRGMYATLNSRHSHVPTAALGPAFKLRDPVHSYRSTHRGSLPCDLRRGAGVSGDVHLG